MQTMRCSCVPLACRPEAMSMLRGSRLQSISTGLQGQRGAHHRQHHSAVQALLPGSEHAADVVAKAAEIVPSQLDHFAARLTTSMLTLADAAASVGVDPLTLSDTASAKQDGGPFGFLAAFFEKILKVLDSGLTATGIPYSYGFAIITLTILVKVATFPLSKKQVESTIAMQQIAPQVKQIQEQYKGRDQQEMQIKVAELYKKAGVNPLAGCLPTLATLPVWIGLYRALSNVANEGLLTEGWFWIPSLAGPSTLASRTNGGGFSWLFPFQNGAPPIGWHDAICYLILPAALVASQFITQKILSPSTPNDPQAQQTNAILKFLPLMIGYFSLNVPSGLTLYWFTNNILTTGQQVWLKRNVPEVQLDEPQQSSTTRKSRTTVEDLAPRPSGAELNLKKKKKGDKFASLKAQETARRAAQATASAAAQATGSEPSSAAQGVDTASGQAAEAIKSGTSVQTKDRDQEHMKVPDAPPSKGSNKSSENGSSSDRK
eukprot:jgi/Astpho2/4985/Aster-06718